MTILTTKRGGLNGFINKRHVKMIIVQVFIIKWWGRNYELMLQNKTELTK